MARLVNLEDLLDPGDDLVGGGVRGLVQVDHAVRLQHLDGPVRGRVAARQRREVRRLHVQLVEVLHNKRTFAKVIRMAGSPPKRKDLPCLGRAQFLKATTRAFLGVSPEEG